MTLVSVIIPTYNRAELLALTLESVLAQSYPLLEIVVVDDGSSDHTATMMNQYSGRVTYIRQTNQGEAVARNNGIQASTGEFLTFLDDDDLILPTKIARQVAYLQAHPEVGLVHCRYYHMDETGRYLDKVGLLPEGDVLPQLVYGDFIWAGAPLIRRQCLEAVGAFDVTLPWQGKYSEDWDLWLRIALAGYAFACIQEPLGAYRLTRGGQSANVAQSEEGVLAILANLLAHPQLPRSLAAAHSAIYAQQRLWFSCRYDANEAWSEAHRNIQEALRLRPHLLTDPSAWLQLVHNQALGYRTRDPLAYVTAVFDHLPPEAQTWTAQRHPFLSRIHVEVALRAYDRQDLPEAEHHLRQALNHDTTILHHERGFAEILIQHALRLPETPPAQFANTVLNQLPPVAQEVKGLRPRILSRISIACAFEAYATGQHQPTIRHVLTALRYQPTWGKNRGVLSILLKSLLGRPSRLAQAT